MMDEKEKEYYKNYREKHREIINARSREYYKNNKDKIKETVEKSRQKHIHRFNETAKIYLLKNREKRLDYLREYRKKHKQKHYDSMKKSRQKRFENDALFAFKNRVRSAISTSFKRRNFKKSQKTIEILGCEIEFFINYVESKFKKGMTLENRQEWHLDHIIPISLAKTKDEVIKLCHYTNFQPLWKIENIKKSNKLLGGFNVCNIL